MECSKLGKTRIIEDATIRLVGNAIFFEPNIPSVFPHEIPKCVSYNITYHTKVTMLIVTVSLKKASCGLPMEEPREAFSHIRYHLDRCHNSVFAVKLYISAGL